jgi:signal transduction histidine kinase
VSPTASEPRFDQQERNRRLIEAGLDLAAELDLDSVLRRIVELAVSITDASYGALGVLDGSGAIREFVTVGVTPEQRAAIGDPPVGRGLLGVIVHEGHTLRVPDVAADPRSGGFPPNHPPMTSLLGSPVMAHGRVFGRLYLTDKRGRDFDEEDEDTVTILAAQAGVAVENARLLEEMAIAQRELLKLEMLEERERIAQELHDGVIQALFAVGMGLQGAAALSGEPEVRLRIEGTVDEIDRAIRDLRNYIFGLRPGILADRQLDQALQELGKEFEGRSGVLTIVDVDVTVAAELASRAADVVQLVREALSNVGRHAHASTCRVSLVRDADGWALLEIDDDGTGFDLEAEPMGMGLGNLARRVETMNGSFSVESVAGEGTTLRARMPL